MVLFAGGVVVAMEVVAMEVVVREVAAVREEEDEDEDEERAGDSLSNNSSL